MSMVKLTNTAWLVAIACGSSAAASMTFKDSNFEDWEIRREYVHRQTGDAYGGILTPMATYVGREDVLWVRVATGGWVDNYTEVTFGGVEIDPAAFNGITSLDVAIDVYPGTQSTGGTSSRWAPLRLAIEQDGRFYYLEPTSGASTEPAWHTFRWDNVTESDQYRDLHTGFLAEAPDFSADAAPMFIGFGVLLNSNTTGNRNGSFRIDNFGVTVNPLPTPSAALVILIGAASASSRRRRESPEAASSCMSIA